ncbi:coil containing protein [Vibrio phage 1.216.O._10N.222.55.C12]|nr:coil containing protein [Vibrio phage 1.213.O._10N.222.54.F10]AUR96183.1 coil containing protein [Vibrio phage 1.216.O._10N.222.55.C12]
MITLEKLAKRIGEIGDEIEACKAQRDINLQHCHGSEDEMFDDAINKEYYDKCLNVAYQWSKCEREESAEDSDCGYAAWGSYSEFYDILKNYGCKNCIGAYEEKRKIGLLKQERGRLVGNISKIGKSL